MERFCFTAEVWIHCYAVAYSRLRPCCRHFGCWLVGVLLMDDTPQACFSNNCDFRGEQSHFGCFARLVFPLHPGKTWDDPGALESTRNKTLGSRVGCGLKCNGFSVFARKSEGNHQKFIGTIVRNIWSLLGDFYGTFSKRIC